MHPLTETASSTATPASPALRRFAWIVLLYFIAVILWGSVVRATGSGAGCGNHWPLCNGSLVQHSASLETLIEFVHRITSGLSLLSVLALLGWTFRGTRPGHLARPAAIFSLLLTLMEAVLGALLVKLDLTANSISPLRPPFLALHLTNTLLLLAALTLTAHFLSRNRGFESRSTLLRGPWRALAAVVLVMLVGVSGSLAALGDTLFPAATLAASFAQDLSNASAWLIRWRWSHPALALLAGAVLVVLLLAARKSQQNRPLAQAVLALLGATLVLGALDVLLLAPIWLQILHLAIAQALWVGVVVLAARTSVVPR